MKIKEATVVEFKNPYVFISDGSKADKIIKSKTKTTNKSRYEDVAYLCAVYGLHASQLFDNIYFDKDAFEFSRYHQTARFVRAALSCIEPWAHDTARLSVCERAKLAMLHRTNRADHVLWKETSPTLFNVWRANALQLNTDDVPMLAKTLDVSINWLLQLNTPVECNDMNGQLLYDLYMLIDPVYRKTWLDACVLSRGGRCEVAYGAT
jgi:hypothetical protein